MAEPSDHHYTIRYLWTAVRDLSEIVEYIGKDSTSAAVSVVDKFDKNISNLGMHPLLGFIPKDPRLERLGYRVLVVDKYLIFYKINENSILIYRILHGARRYSPLL